MEWILGALVVWLVLARRRDRRVRTGAARDVRLDDGREALRIEGSLFAPATSEEPGWRHVIVEETAAAQPQHRTTVDEVLSGSGAAGGGRPGMDPDVAVEAVPVVLLPTLRGDRVTGVDVYAAGGRLGRLPAPDAARHGAELLEVQRVEGRPGGVEARILRGDAGDLGTEVLLPDRFEATPPG